MTNKRLNRAERLVVEAMIKGIDDEKNKILDYLELNYGKCAFFCNMPETEKPKQELLTALQAKRDVLLATI